MNPRLKRVLRRMAGTQLVRVRRARLRFGEPSWSQEGEDRILWRFFNYRTSGFYVDVGAHDPFRFSNTCLLHKAGWRGINIDAMPGSMAAFRSHRSGDVNLEVGVSEQPGSAAFHTFAEPALNTFDTDAAQRLAASGCAVERIIDVPLRPLRDILAEHAAQQPIDLLTVDAEGHDLSVLRSNDWTRFRPLVVLAESLGRTIDDLNADPCAQFMRASGYGVFAKTVNTVMYIDGSRDSVVA